MYLFPHDEIMLLVFIGDVPVSSVCRYAAELSGISNAISEVSGIIAPLVVTLMTPNVSTSMKLILAVLSC